MPATTSAEVPINVTSTLPIQNGETKPSMNGTACTNLDLSDAPVGSITDIKSLYQGPKDNDGQAQWLDKYPEDVAETEETAKYALIARKTKCYDGRKKFDIDSIIISSPGLKKILGRVLNDYPGITCELDRLVFDAPFNCFVHRWAEFVEAMNSEPAGKAKEHIELLHSLLKEELKDTIKALEDYVVHGVTTFQHLWTIFQPGSIVYCKFRGTQAAFSFYRGEYKDTQCGKCFELCMEPIGWGGSNFARGTEYMKIFSFAGTRPIKTLNALPLSFHPEKEAIKASLIQRGIKYEQLAGCHYKAYDGVALSWDSEGNLVPVTVGGRIVIDRTSFSTANPGRGHNFNGGLHDADYVQSEILTESTNSISTSPQIDYSTEEEPKISLTAKAHLICEATVGGYSLKLKKWLYFFVDLVKEIKWNDNAFEKLVLPSDTKELLLSFVESQVENKNNFDDIVQGKGKGIIMLLSGPPGVGKTLTAEAVAESMHIPLFSMGAGDLGIRPYRVEESLQEILEMVAKWNAIFLVDECDVFLEARDSHDLERNKLVSIFLRTLEYYEGILFLTTNRVSNMDAAFQSRIHVSLPYPALTTASRRQIWANFLGSSKQASEVSDVELDNLAEIDLNGRQIKNVLKTAFLLSARKKMPLTKEFIDTVLAIEGRRPGLGA